MNTALYYQHDVAFHSQQKRLFMTFLFFARCILLPAVSSPYKVTPKDDRSFLPICSVGVLSGACCLDAFLSWIANVARSCMAHLGQNSSSQLAASSRVYQYSMQETDLIHISANGPNKGAKNYTTNSTRELKSSFSGLTPFIAKKKHVAFSYHFSITFSPVISTFPAPPAPPAAQ